jgi:predicted membrane metal-binding protein
MKYFISRKIIKNRMIFILFSAVLTTLSATLLTLPVSIYAFGYVSNVSLFTNLAISFAINLVIWITVISLVINLMFPTVAGLMFEVCEPIVAYVNSVINEFGSIENAITVTPAYTLPIAIFIILLIS